MAKLLTGTRIYGTGTVDTQLFVNGTEQAVSTTTGALEVIGGAGIGGNLHLGGISVSAGVQTTNIVASGTLGVTGTTTLTVLNATSATFSGTLGVTGTSVLNGLQASNIVASGTLGVTGTSTLAGITLVTNTTSATSITTGALVVSGGVGIGQDLRVGGVIYGTFNGAVTGTATNAINISGGTAGQVPYQTAPGTTSFYGPGTAGNVLVSNGAAAPSYNNTLTLAGTTAATSTATGTLQVRGGVGVGGAVWANAVIAVNTISNGLNSANFVARPDGTTSSQRTGVSFYGTFFNFPSDVGPRRAADIVSGFASGTWGTEYLSFNVGNGGTPNDAQLITTEQVRITTTATLVLSSTTSISTTTGALVVTGGVGIGKSLFVQESIVQVGGTYSTLAATYNLINTTATTVNFAGAATSLNVGATSGSTNVRNNLIISGNLTVQGTTTIVDSTVTNIADPIITLGGGSGNNNPTTDDNKDRGVAFKWVNNGGTTSTGFFGYDDSTGHLTYIQTATITNEVVSGTKGAVDANLAGGTAMSIVYQSAANTTAFLAAGSSGFILQTNGTSAAPTWVSASGIGAGSATNSDAIRTIERTTAAAHFLTFVDSNNATNAYESLYTTSSFYINPNSGAVNIGGNLTAPYLYASGGATINEQVYIDMNGVSSAEALALRGGSGASGGVYMKFQSPSATTGYFGHDKPITGGSTYDLTAYSTTGLGFRVHTDGNATPRLLIAANGNVGIGAAPTAVTGFGINRFLEIAGSSVPGIVFRPTGSTSEHSILGAGDGLLLGATGAATASGNNVIRFFTSNVNSSNAPTERLRITAAGGIAFNGAANYGSSGQILQSNGDTAPTWVSPSTLASASATNADNIRTVARTTNASHFLTFVDSNNASAAYEPLYTTSSFTINPQSGVLTTSIGSAISYGDGTTYLVWIDEPEVSVLHTSADSNYKNMKTFVASKSGSFKLKFSAYIQSGPKYWGWRILKNGSTVPAGPYAYTGSLDSGQTASVHGYVRFAVTISDVAPGDSFVLQMVSTAGGSTPDIGGNQLLYAKEFRVYSTTPSVDHGGATNIWGAQVGIGTTSPTAKFTISNTGSTSAAFYADIGNPGGATTLFEHTGASTPVPFRFRKSGFSGASPNYGLFYLHMNDGTVGNGSNLYFNLNNSAGTEIEYAGLGAIIRSNTAASEQGDLAFYVVSGGVGRTERLRITSAGALAVNGASNFGSSGQVLQSNGNAPPSWINQSSITSGGTSLTNTYVGYGSASNLLTGSSNFTWDGTKLLVSGTSISPYIKVSGTGGTYSYIQLDDSSSNGYLIKNVSSGTGNGALAGALYTYTDNSKAFQHIHAGTPLFTILSTGNVGIGTTSPSGRLHLYQTAGGSNTLTLDTNFVNGNAYAINPFITGISNGGLSIRDVTNSADRLVIQYSTGNVGIGTTAPDSKLHVEVGNATAYTPANTLVSGQTARISNTDATSGVSANLLFVAKGAGGGNGLGSISGVNTGVGSLAFTFGTRHSSSNVTERMRITSDGNVVIGTTSTLNKFEVAGTSGQLFSVSDSFTGTIFSVNDVSGIPSIEVLDTGLIKMAQYNGVVAIGTGTVSSSTAELSVYGMLYTMGTLGEIRASSEITAYFSSDARLKENIKLIENPITIIDQIRGVTFDWTDEHMARRGGEDGYFVRKHDIGVIAQEVQAVLPELVGTREDGYLAVKYEKLVPLLIEAIKTQQKTIDSLVKDLDTVKEFINNLKNGI